MRARYHSLAWSSALLVASLSLRAEAAGYRLSLVRAEGTSSCTTASDLERDVTARLGRNPFSPSAERGIEIVLDRSEAKWRARLFLRVDDASDDAARILESDAPDCAELGKWVTLAVALALEPELPPAPPAPTVRAPPPPPPAPPVRRSLHGAAALRMLVSPNVLPRVAPGVALSVTLRGDLLGLHVGASFYPQQELERAGARLGFGLSVAQLSGCLWPRQSEPQLWSCLGAQVGALHTVVFAPEPSRPGDRVWAAASSELGLRQSLVGRSFVELGAMASFPFVRHRFAVGAESGAEPRVAFEQRGVVLEGFVGLGLRLD